MAVYQDFRKKKVKIGDQYKGDANTSAVREQETAPPKPTGSYNPNKKQYEGADGKVYPNADPNFVPNLNAEQIRFTNGNKVLVSPAGTDKTIELSKEEYNVSKDVEMGRGKLGAGASENLKKLQEERAITPEQRAALGNIGNYERTTDSGANVSDLALNTTLGAGAIGAGAATGAGIGAAAGPVGAAIGALIGAGGAALKLNWDQKQSTKEAYNTFQNAKAGISQTITALNQGTITPEQAVEIYNQKASEIYAAERALKRKTSNAVGRMLSRAMDELADVEAYKELLIIQQQKLRLAVMAPNPNAVEPLQISTTTNG